MNWTKFLELARCPGQYGKGRLCLGILEQSHNSLVCQKCASTWAQSIPYGIPCFVPRIAHGLTCDACENANYREIERYAGIWAFGYLFMQRGEAEGFYRTINELAFSTPLAIDGAHCILDLGCGVGRTSCDYARHYTNAAVIGVDHSPKSLAYAYAIVIGDSAGPNVKILLDKEGFEEVSAASFGLANVFLVQADAQNLPFADEKFDLVVSANLIDRVDDPLRVIAEAVRVLKPGGYLILADPFNWVATNDWWNGCQTIQQFTALLDQSSLDVEVAFDGLLYREVRDVRNAYTDWRVAVARATKRVLSR